MGHAALSCRDVRIERRVFRTAPHETEAIGFRLRGVAHTHAHSAIRFLRNFFLTAHEPLRRGVPEILRRHGLEFHRDIRRPLDALQPIEPCSLLHVADDDNLAARSRIHARAAEQIERLQNRLAEIRPAPSGTQRRKSLHRAGHALIDGHRAPLLGIHEHARRAIERNERHCIEWRRRTQQRLGLFARLLPEHLAPHARARIHEDREPAGGTHRVTTVRLALAEKWPRKAERHRHEHEAAQEQQPEILDAAPARHSRRRGLEKHERAERLHLACRATDEMENDRCSDCECAQQEER